MMEAIIGISVAMMGLLGILTLFTRSLAYNHDLERRLTATYLAAEGIELVHAKIDENYMNRAAWDFDIFDGSYQIDYRSTALGLSGTANRISFVNERYVQEDPASNPLPYVRKVEIQKITHNGNSDELRVVSRVSWDARTGPTETVLEDHFFNWKPGVILPL